MMFVLPCIQYVKELYLRYRVMNQRTISNSVTGSAKFVNRKSNLTTILSYCYLGFWKQRFSKAGCKCKALF
jgi:hypothetical protein